MRVAPRPCTPVQALGAFADDAGTTFRSWTTAHARCAVRLYDDSGRALRTEAMTDLGDGVFEARLAGVGTGARYRFVLDDRELEDPYARSLPDGIGKPAMVVRSRYEWRHAHVVRPLREHAIYELHVGTFTRAGTYAAAIERLPALVDLGVTAIELMPLATYGGARGWGYDGVAHYAPHAAYGTPDELRAFVDAAHGAGLSVLLDVVYNHFGPAGNIIGQYAPEYFTREVANFWGEAPDFRQPWMRRYVLDNVRMWIDEFRFDGLRLDAVHAMVDPSELHILREIASVARGVLPGALLIAEDDRNDPAIVLQQRLDATWADDFHHAVHVTLTGERDGYYACYEPGAATIARTIEHGWLYEGQTYPTSGKPRGRPAAHLPAEAFVYCIQNHDQIGNRAMGERLAQLVSPEAYRAASTLLLFLPMTPLLFQGDEWAASTPFQYFTDHDAELGAIVSKGRREEFSKFRAFADPAERARIPDPQAPSTFAASHLDWDERDSHRATLDLYRALLRLRREDPVLASAGRPGLSATTHGPLLVVRRFTDAGSRTLVANLTAESADSPIAGRILLSSSPVALPLLPPWSAVIVEQVD